MRDLVKFFARGSSRRDTKESIRRYSERRQRSLTYCNKRKVQCEVYINYLRRYKKYLVVNNRKTFSDENLRHKVKTIFDHNDKSLFVSACIIYICRIRKKLYKSNKELEKK